MADWAKHLAKQPLTSEQLKGLDACESVCGVTAWSGFFNQSREVTCLRCRGTEAFYVLELEEKVAEYEAAALAKAQTKKEIKWAKRSRISSGGSRYRVAKVVTTRRRARRTRPGSQV